jgi:hypothetical protein
VGTQGVRAFIVSYDLPSRSGDPVVVLAARRNVWYVDGGDLEILSHREFGENESIVISQNGKFIAVFSRFYHQRTGKTGLCMRAYSVGGVHCVHHKPPEGAILWAQSRLHTPERSPSPANL